MADYLTRRLLQSAVTVWLVVTIVFIMLHVMPGSTARAVLGQRAYPAEIAAFDRRGGLDLPWPVQYARFLTALATRGQLTFATPNPHSMYQVINGYGQGASLLQLLAGPVADTALLVGIALAISVPAVLTSSSLTWRCSPGTSRPAWPRPPWPTT